MTRITMMMMMSTRIDDGDDDDDDDNNAGGDDDDDDDDERGARCKRSGELQQINSRNSCGRNSWFFVNLSKQDL